MQVKRQQLELDVEQQTGSKLGKEYVKAVAERGSLLPLEMEACLPGCVWNATPRSLSPLERNIGFWTQA